MSYGQNKQRYIFLMKVVSIFTWLEIRLGQDLIKKSMSTVLFKKVKDFHLLLLLLKTDLLIGELLKVLIESTNFLSLLNIFSPDYAKTEMKWPKRRKQKMMKSKNGLFLITVRFMIGNKLLNLLKNVEWTFCTFLLILLNLILLKIGSVKWRQKWERQTIQDSVSCLKSCREL